MAFNVHDTDDDVISEINIVPFVDIVLVLLITFMLTSSAIVKAGIQVDLPSAASAGEAVSSTLNVVLTREGVLFLDGQEIGAAALATHVAKTAWKQPELQAVISADTKVDYGQVVKVIDLVKQNGVKSFALNLQREQ